MLVKISENDRCTEEIINKFEELNFKNKICFTSKEYKDIKCAIQIKECENLQYVYGEWQYYENYIDIKNILNNIKIKEV